MICDFVLNRFLMILI